jgi:hypothetical protein
MRLLVHVFEGEHDCFHPYFPNSVRVHYCLRWRRDGTCALGWLDCEALFLDDASGLMNVPKSRVYVINECFQKKTGVRIPNLRGSVKGAEFFDQ